MRKILSLISVVILMSACADSKEYIIEGNVMVVEPYGWANYDNKVDGIRYKPSVGNVVLSVLFVETIVVPIWLTGWELYEPVECVTCKQDTLIITPISF